MKHSAPDPTEGSSGETRTSSRQGFPGRRRPRARIVGLGVGVLVLGALAATLHQRWQELPAEFLSPDGPRLILAVLLVLAGVVAAAFVWRRTLSGLGVRLSIAESVYVHFASQAGKYVPGKVLLLAGKVVLATRQGAPPGPVAASVAYEQAFSLLSGALMALACGAAAGGSAVEPYRAWMLGVAIIGLAAVHPSMVGGFFRLIQRVLGSDEAPAALSYATTLRILAGFALPWLLSGLGFYVFVTAWAPLDIRLLPDMVAVLALSGLAGLLALFAPAGLGVREATQAALLAVYFPLAVSLAIPLAFRVAVTLVDLAAVAIGLALRPHCRRIARPSSVSA